MLHALASTNDQSRVLENACLAAAFQEQMEQHIRSGLISVAWAGGQGAPGSAGRWAAPRRTPHCHACSAQVPLTKVLARHRGEQDYREVLRMETRGDAVGRGRGHCCPPRGCSPVPLQSLCSRKGRPRAAPRTPWRASHSWNAGCAYASCSLDFHSAWQWGWGRN